METLPIDPVLPDVLAALSHRGVCVLQAPPGAGKTTRVPLYLLENELTPARILMLEPRRVAAHAAAERLAEGLGEHPGNRVGYRMRGESIPGARIEVVTEGILTRMIQSDPGLDGIGCIIFDEFHERSLQADLGLALCLEIRAALRGDLKLLVMSATLDAAPVAALIGNAPVVTSSGRSFPVETHWLDRPLGQQKPIEFARAVAAQVLNALDATTGGILVFLPGVAEISRVQSILNGKLSPEVVVLPLHGSLPFRAQRAAILPRPDMRKIVLATAIAETSLTIEDICVVIDAGKARRARFDPGCGMSRLVTERVTKAEAEQRRGRAGRVAPGICYRLWTKGEEGGFAGFAPPEITSADLAPLALDLALWGARGAGDVPFLTPPPESALNEAQSLLAQLGALDQSGAITAHGKAIAKVPAHPRLAHMLIAGGGVLGAELAALCEGRDILRGEGADMTLRLQALRDPRKFTHSADSAARAQAKETVARLKPFAGKGGDLSAGALLSLAYPDRIAMRRSGDAARFLLSGGTGAFLAPDDPLSGVAMLVAADLDGDRREARIRSALAVSLSEIRAVHSDRLVAKKICEWSQRDGRVLARERLMLGALVLEDRDWKDADPQASIAAMIEGIRAASPEALGWSAQARRFQARVNWLRARGSDLPDLSDPALLDRLEDWLGPWLTGCRTLAAVRRIDFGAALKGLMRREHLKLIDQLAPDSITAPTGTVLKIDYDGAAPSVSVRLQEMFGLRKHPVVGPDKVPLVIELLSPGHRPVQTTADLPRFWASSYADVRKDMRGRYPKHPWPEDPLNTAPTRRAKPRS